MTFALTWLPQVLEDAGLKVAETLGWRTRGRAEMDDIRGVICHHTATPQSLVGNMPTLNLLVSGRAAGLGAPALQGPLAQLGLGRDGTFYVVAAGRANHAGAGRWEGLVNLGNACFIGIEAENSGAADDDWPAVQLDAYHRGVAAILKKIGAGANMCCGHKEYAEPPGRKVDPSFDMPAFRSEVASLLAGKTPPAPIPATDSQQRPTLRRGSTGPFVQQAQALVSVAADGVFGAATEAAVRVAQRKMTLVPDGIIGPATWAALTSSRTAAAVEAAVAPGPSLPAADDAQHAPEFEGMVAVGPDGRRFASRQGNGLVTTGETSLDAWLSSGDAGTSSLSPSVMRILSAVSRNEGDLEAVNSYDDCHLSFGMFQWTAGADEEPGELPALLERMKASDADVFHDCFGSYGLDIEVGDSASTGLFTLSGIPLQTGTQKDVLRDLVWGYRFWRAGHHPVMRTSELMHAAERIRRFDSCPTTGRPLRDWLSSELGIAMVLDEHVNRPGHVPGTLEQAIQTLQLGAAASPDGWTDADEHRLILAYLDVRRTTSMTGSDKRAAVIAGAAQQGKLSQARGSYDPGP